MSAYNDTRARGLPGAHAQRSAVASADEDARRAVAHWLAIG